MKAILIRQFGGPEVLKLEDVPTPKPLPRQVLVKIRAAGVNPADTYARTGNYSVIPPLPYTPGTDAAGTIHSIGDRVQKVNAGAGVSVAQSIPRPHLEARL